MSPTIPRVGLYVLIVVMGTAELATMVAAAIAPGLAVGFLYAAGALGAVLLAWVLGWTWWFNR